MQFFFTENFLFIFYRLISIKIPKICFNFKAALRTTGMRHVHTCDLTTHAWHIPSNFLSAKTPSILHQIAIFFTENLLFIFNRLFAIKIPKICFNYKADNYGLRLTSHASAQDVGHPIDAKVHNGSVLAQTSQTVTKSIFRFFLHQNYISSNLQDFFQISDLSLPTNKSVSIPNPVILPERKWLLQQC